MKSTSQILQNIKNWASGIGATELDVSISARIDAAALAKAASDKMPFPDRIAYLRSHIDREELGLEIGPSHSPVAARALDYNVRTIDHMDQDGLKAKYAAHPGVDLTAIEPVDYIWSGGPYSALVGEDIKFDYAIASHVIEHSTDLIGFLQDLQGLIKPEGRIILACPDHRYCFDHFRPITGLASVIDKHLDRKNFHSAGTAAEYSMNIVTRDGRIAWGKGLRGKFEFLSGAEQARAQIAQVVADHSYIDVHAWVFTPGSFHLMIEDLRALGYLDLHVDLITGARGLEFFAVLRRTPGATSQPTRLELLRRIKLELLEGVYESMDA